MSSSSRTISALEARNHFGRVLDRVAEGEQLVITRRGRPVAWMIPIDKSVKKSAYAALAMLRKVRKELQRNGVRISREEIRDWKGAGRQ
jgi:prevent-host-death family protein